jgi:hypothetical protein
MPVLVGLSVALIVIVAAIIGYRHFFNRPGEKAVALIPADALLVATLDTNPSPTQLMTFQQIEKALKREGIDGSLDKWLTANASSDKGGKFFSQFRKYWNKSLAFALFGKPNGPAGSDPNVALLFAISDKDAVYNLMTQNGQKHSLHDMEYYSSPSDKGCMALISDYFVVTNSPETLERIHAVYTGKAKSVAALSHYREARAALPSDANMMVFVTPKALEQLPANATSAFAPAMKTALKTSRWLAMSLTLTPKGIEVVTQTPVVTPSGMKLPAPPEAIRSDLARHLPSGAYGVATYAQPGRLWDWVQMAGQQDPESQRAIADGFAAFEHETGMSVPKDVLPGLNGDLTLAVYPDPTRAGTSGVDGLIVMDNANGADPAALMAKVRAYVERASSKDGQSGIHFITTSRGGATIVTLDPATEARLHGSSSGSQSDPTSPTHADVSSSDSIAHVTPVSAPGGFAGGSTPSGSPANGTQPASDALAQPAEMLKTKTFVYAQVGNAILMASSRAMLDRALDAYQTGRHTLADDAHYRAMFASIPSGSQAQMLISATQILDALRPAILRETGNDPSGLTPDDVIQIFSQNGGLVGSGRYDGKTMTSKFTLFMDYDKLIHMIGIMSRPPSPAHNGVVQNGAVGTVRKG